MRWVLVGQIVLYALIFLGMPWQIVAVLALAITGVIFAGVILPHA